MSNGAEKTLPAFQKARSDNFYQPVNCVGSENCMFRYEKQKPRENTDNGLGQRKHYEITNLGFHPRVKKKEKKTGVLFMAHYLPCMWPIWRNNLSTPLVAPGES